MLFDTGHIHRNKKPKEKWAEDFEQKNYITISK